MCYAGVLIMECMAIVISAAVFMVMLLISALMFSGRGEAKAGVIVITAEGSIGEIEAAVKAVYQEECFDSLKNARRIIVMLTHKTQNRERLKMLEHRYENVYCVEAADIVEFILKR